MTPQLLIPVEAACGKPQERNWTVPIYEHEMQMVVASTRGQRRLHDVTLFISNPRGDLALIRKHSYPQGAWRAPGGGVHPGEEFAAGAIREAWEETGLRVRPQRYLLKVDVTFSAGTQVQPWTTYILTAQTDDEQLQTQDPKEIAGLKWGTLDELCGPVEQVLMSTGRGLFRYRIALHQEVRRLLAP